MITGHVGSKTGLLLFAGLILKQYGYYWVAGCWRHHGAVCDAFGVWILWSLDPVHACWQECASWSYRHRSKAVICALSGLLRDEALKLVISSPGSLFCPLQPCPLRWTLSCVWLLPLGLFSPVVAGVEPPARAARALLQRHGPAPATAMAVKASHEPCTSVFYWQYYLKPFFGIRGLAFYVRRGASPWLWGP